MYIGRDPVGSLPGLAELWRRTTGSPDIGIAVLDGPTDLAHPSFGDSRLEYVSKASVSSQALPKSLHGTHVASLLFGQHSGPVRGMAPTCRGVLVPLYRERDDGELAPCSQTDLARAISTALQRGAQIINVSGGELASSGEAQHFLADAIRKCADQNILIIAATGNDGCKCLHVPASVPTVLAVGAADDDGRPLPSSNWDPGLARHGVLAPGYRIPCAAPNGSLAEMSGTSAAAPIVSGVVALLMSLQLEAGGRPDLQDIFRAIVDSALPCTPADDASDCERMLGGRLNIPGAYLRLFGSELSQGDVGTSIPGVFKRRAIPLSALGSSAPAVLPHQIPKTNRSNQSRGGQVIMSESNDSANMATSGTHFAAQPNQTPTEGSANTTMHVPGHNPGPAAPSSLVFNPAAHYSPTYAHVPAGAFYPAAEPSADCHCQHGTTPSQATSVPQPNLAAPQWPIVATPYVLPPHVVPSVHPQAYLPPHGSGPGAYDAQAWHQASLSERQFATPNQNTRFPVHTNLQPSGAPTHRAFHNRTNFQPTGMMSPNDGFPGYANIHPSYAPPVPYVPAVPYAPTVRGDVVQRSPGTGPGTGNLPLAAQFINARNSELIYVTCELSYDFGTDARRDYFVQQFRMLAEDDTWKEWMEKNDLSPDDVPLPENQRVMARFIDPRPDPDFPRLTTHPEDAERLVFTGVVEQMHIYAFRPIRAFAPIILMAFAEILRDQAAGESDRMSIGGRIIGDITLYNGDTVPVVDPSLSNLFNWTIPKLVDALSYQLKTTKPDLTFDEEAWKERVRNFLDRVYYEIRNLGQSPQDRALNYFAVNAFSAGDVFAQALADNLELDAMRVEASPYFRPYSECYDVIMTFFDPAERLTKALQEWRLTVDVSDVTPVSIGKIRHWSRFA